MSSMQGCSKETCDSRQLMQQSGTSPHDEQAPQIHPRSHTQQQQMQESSPHVPQTTTQIPPNQQDATESQDKQPQNTDLNETLSDIYRLQRQKGWQILLQSEHVPFLRHHCVICARWIVDSTASNRHIKYGHPTIWKACEPQLRITCAPVQSHIKRDTTCKYCLRKAYSRHSFQCCVIFQSALLHIHRDGRSLHAEGNRDNVRALAAGPGSTTASAAADTKRPPSSPSVTDSKRQRQARRGGGQRQQDRDNSMEEVIQLLTKIAIQHEDQINSAKQDTSFTMFFEQTGKMGILTNLYRASQEWHAHREAKPNQRHHSWRTTLLALLPVEMESRLQLEPEHIAQGKQ